MGFEAPNKPLEPDQARCHNPGMLTGHADDLADPEYVMANRAPNPMLTLFPFFFGEAGRVRHPVSGGKDRDRRLWLASSPRGFRTYIGRRARSRARLNSQFLGKLCDLLKLTIVPGIRGEGVFPPVRAD